MAPSPHQPSDRSRMSSLRGRHALLGILLAFGIPAACAHDGEGSRAGDATATSADGAIPIRIIRDWERRMTQYGHRVGEYLATETDPSLRLNAQYYDGQWVFLRIAEYTGEDEPWTRYAELAEKAYKGYLSKHDYSAAGWMQFPHGLYVDWKRNGDEQSREFLLGMREEAAFADPLRGIADGWYKQKRSREVAYSLETQILAEKAGAPRDAARLERFVDMALTHAETWSTGNYRASDPEEQYCQPFMAGLTASALISYYERSVELGEPDERVPAAIRRLADWLWQETWVPNVEGTEYGAFEYRYTGEDDAGGNPAPDLNMLIAPMYGWLYYRTGDTEYRRRGDAIFAGGVALADLGNGKRFNQSYRSSFDYIMWRNAGETDTQADRRIGPAVAWAPDQREP